MLRLLGLVLAAVMAAAGLPTRKQPAQPWEAAQPPTALAVRQLLRHRALPKSPGDEPISEEGTGASFEAFLRARGGRLEPMWANHSHAERTANLQRHHASRRSERRRAQAMLGTNLFADATAQEKDSSLVAVLDPPASTCDDPLATNAGQPTPCTYDCAELQREYFPEPQSQTTRCFLFDPSTETWPEVGGEGAELLSLREQCFETHTYISVEDGTNPPPSGLSFTMGEGRVCRDVTIKTFMGMESREETVCLVDGEHEYNHTVTEEHSVEVVGYAESGVHDGAGGTTSFAVGECTDALIRVTTTSAGGGSMTWSLDDGGHNGPWTFETSGEVGVEEHESCMFDNEFTLTLQGGGLGWEGSVEVVGFIHYHNTITVPNDENWIVQGIVDPVSGLPSSLDGRLKSGSAVDRSHANIVLRHLRISGQVAPLDVNPLSRTGLNTGLPTFGGAFEYDGGSADPDDLAKLVFIEVVFDHNTAPGGAGGAIFIDGRAAMPSLDPAVQIWESGIALTIISCTFFRNFAAFVAGAIGVYDAFPLVSTSSNAAFLDSDATVYQHEQFYWNAHSGPTLRSGIASVSRTGNHYDGGFTSAGIFNYVGGVSSTMVDGGAPDAPNATWIGSFHGCSFVDHAAWLTSMTVHGMVYPVLPDKLIRTEFTFVDSSITESVHVTTGAPYDGMYMVAHLAQGSSLVDRCRFERSGNFDENAVGQGGIGAVTPPGGSIVPSWEFSNSEWDGNAGAKAPALYMWYGNFALRFFRCVFRENVAYQAGGAILVQGPAISSLLVEESVFDSNAVQVSINGGGTVDVTVRLSTGGFPIGSTEGYWTPIWRIDDGPVYGIPYEQCQMASQWSQDAVSKGLPPSWPDLQCANVSYTGPDSLFAHVVSLDDGPHTLWTGLLVMSHNQNSGWQQAWIELVDTIGPLYPNPPETRLEQFPGCILNQCVEPDALTNPACSEYCPPGVAMWSSYDFIVSSGKGGAIATAGPVPVSISDSVFRTNDAPKGASLSVTGASSLRITNTTIDEPVNEASSAVHTIASAVAVCADNPCEAGSKCTFRDFSTFCEPCGDNEMGADGVECSVCPSGTQPDASHTQCLPCAVGSFSTIGTCFDCDARETSNDDKDGCEPCPVNQLADPPELGCRCQRGYYNSSAVRPACFRGAWAEDGERNDESAVCLPCDELECIADCQGDLLRIGTGWSPAQASGSSVPIFSCKYNLSDVDVPPSCPGGFVSSAHSVPLAVYRNGTWLNLTQDAPCAEGYKPPLCGACNDSFTLESDGSCVPCGGASATSAMIVGIVALVALAVLAKTVPIWFDYFTMLQEIAELTRSLELKAISKMLVATMQILGNLADVLSIRLPEVFTRLLASFVSVFKFDIISMLKLGCVSTGSYISTLITAVSMVLLVAVAVGLIYLYEMRRLDRADYDPDDKEAVADLRELYEQFDTDGDGIQLEEVQAIVLKIEPTTTPGDVEALFKTADADGSGHIDFEEFNAAVNADTDDAMRLDLGILVKKKAQANIRDTATGRLFLLVFLLYPSLTNKILQGFACRQIGQEISILNADYAMDCESSEYNLLFLTCILLTLLWPIGVPGVLFYAMFKVRKEIMEEDQDTLQKFDFVLGDYDKEHWYWEIVELIRKLILAGLIGIAARGSVFQTVLATAMCFMFFAFAFRAMPYNTTRLNIVKVLSELQLFGILLVCVVLQTEKNGLAPTELLRKHGYGVCQVVLTLAIIPVTLWVLRKNLVDFRELAREQLDRQEEDRGDDETVAVARDEAAVAKQRGGTPLHVPMETHSRQEEGVPPRAAVLGVRTQSGGRPPDQDAHGYAQPVRSASGRLRATARVVRVATPELHARERRPLAEDT